MQVRWIAATLLFVMLFIAGCGGGHSGDKSGEKQSDMHAIFWCCEPDGSWGHDGGDPGVSTSMRVDNNGVAAIFFMNIDENSIDPNSYGEIVNTIKNAQKILRG